MANVNLEHPFREIHGAIERKGIINRQKKFRDDNGRVIFEGRQEAYAVKRPRDFKKNPPQGEELAHHNRWREACLRANQIILSMQEGGLTEQQQFHQRINHIPAYYTQEEAQALYTHYHQRYTAQLPNTRGTHPDPQAPIDKTTRTPKRYHQFPAFLRAMLYLQLKSVTTQN